MKSWYNIEAKGDVAEISIYEEIGLYGVTAKQFLNDLRAVGNRRILLRLNSPGGDVFEGLAIYNRLREHSGGVEVRIDGLAASMASVIATAGNPVRIAENALVMIHNPSGLVVGDAENMREVAGILDKVRGSIITAYERKTGLSPEKLGAMMDAETWLNASEAKASGFVDDVTEPLKMAARFRACAKFRHAPAALRAEVVPERLTQEQWDARYQDARTPEERSAVLAGYQAAVLGDGLAESARPFVMPSATDRLTFAEWNERFAAARTPEERSQLTGLFEKACAHNLLAD